VSDSAVEILLLNLDGFLFGVFDKLNFVAGDNHVVDADGDAGFGGIGEAKLLQAVEQNDGALETETEVGVIDELLNAFLFEQAVNERHVRGQVRIENDAADGGLDELTLHLDRLGVSDVLVIVSGDQVDDFARVTEADRSEQFDFASFEREADVIGGTEDAAFALAPGLFLVR